MRTAEIKRKTGETDIALSLSLDGVGNASVDTGVGFLDHMLTLFARHARYDLTVKCVGDTAVDDHHSVEDVGIALGRAFRSALGDARGIVRYGQRYLPMDETLTLAAVDISGRGYLGYALSVRAYKIGSFDTELCEEFFRAFTREAGVTLHLRTVVEGNTHHTVEGAFKAFARAMAEATAIDPRFSDEIPSTKGVI